MGAGRDPAEEPTLEEEDVTQANLPVNMVPHGHPQTKPRYKESPPHLGTAKAPGMGPA